MRDEIDRRSFAFNRMPGARNNRGRIPDGVGVGAAPSATWLSTLGALAWWVRPDMGYTMGTGVAAWADQSGNGVHELQGTGSLQPALLAADLDGYSAVAGDGVNDFLSAVWARAAPSVQPFYVRLIVKQISFTASDTLIGDFVGANGFIVQQNVASPNIRMYNVSSGNVSGGGAIGSYVRLEMQFTGSVADYIKVGAAAQVAGTNSGDLIGGGALELFHGGASSGGGVYGNVAIVEAAIHLGTPGAPARTTLDAIDVAKYPSAIF